MADNIHREYPGYNSDPKVLKTIRRCRAIKGEDGAPISIKKRRPTAGRNPQSEYYHISTLRSKMCPRRAAYDLYYFPRNPGVRIHKNMASKRSPDDLKYRPHSEREQIGGGLLNDPVLQSYLQSTKQFLQESTLLPLGVFMTLLYTYHTGDILTILESITDWVRVGPQIFVPVLHIL